MPPSRRRSVSAQRRSSATRAGSTSSKKQKQEEEEEDHNITASPSAPAECSSLLPGTSAIGNVIASSAPSAAMATRAATHRLKSTCSSALGPPVDLVMKFKKTAFLIIVIIAAYSLREQVPDTSNVVPTGMKVEEQHRPGLLFDKKSIRKRHPIVMVPGFISSALELWESRECASSDLTTTFRQRMFGANMIVTLLRNPKCFLEHFSLNYSTGGDPDGVRVRPDGWLGAADYLVPGFWVWAKIIINLGDIGYDPLQLHMASYDWRLDPNRMESRDRYFTRLKNQIESMTSMYGERVVILSHSYGSVVTSAFLNWASASCSSCSSSSWMDLHIEAFVNIGGPILGLPKAVSAIASGEIRDTAMLPSAARLLVDSHINRLERGNCFRSWLSLSAMYPIGCNALWKKLLTVRRTDVDPISSALSKTNQRTRTFSSATFLPELMILANQSGHVALLEQLTATAASPTAWPQLPRATTSRVYCFYGVNSDSEGSYTFTNDPSGADAVRGFPLTLDVSRRDSGVTLVNGDGTVPLVSLGLMCRAHWGWKKHLGVEKVVTVEYHHATQMLDPRGGVTTGDHVDIMGNYELIENVLKIATGFGSTMVKDRVVSEIDDIVTDLEENGCAAEG